MGRLTRAQRIRKRPDFVRIQDGGSRVSTRHYLWLLAAGPDAQGLARLGVVASRKVGGAIERNRSKRVLREVFRHNTSLFANGLDVVVIIRAGAHLLSFQQAQAELQAMASLIRRRGDDALRAARSAAVTAASPGTPRSELARR